MLDIRTKMINGIRIDGCRQCYQIEDNGGVSQRMTANNESFEIIDNYNLDQKFLPVTLDLKINNVCNLKCRMCQPRDSNQIHKEFKKILKENQSFSFYTNTKMQDADLGIDLDLIPEWDGSPAFLKSLHSLLPKLRKISVVGGEPLLSQSFYQLLDLCISSGNAKNIYIAVTTNLTKVPVEKLLTYQKEFHSFLFNISLDAIGEELNYIRFPSEFNEIKSNFKKIYLKDHSDRITYQFSPTVQIYNILSLDKIFTFVEELLSGGYQLSNTPVHTTFLEYPVHLNIRILPATVRESAIKKLTDMQINCPLLMTYPAVRANVEQIINTLRGDIHPYAEKYMNHFMHYTLMLDKERNQSFAASLPELHNLLSGVIPLAPKEYFIGNKTRGWLLGKLERMWKVLKSVRGKSLSEKITRIRETLSGYHFTKRDYEEALELAPENPVVLKGLVLTLFKEKDFVKSRMLLPLAIDKNPDDPDLLKLHEFFMSKKAKTS